MSNPVTTLEEVDRAVFVYLENKIAKHPDSDFAGAFYNVLGHQPDKKDLAELDNQIPLIWVKRPGPPQASDKRAPSQGEFYEVATTVVVDEVEKPSTYNVLKKGSIDDLTYDIKYISFHERDERAMAGQLSALFPKNGIALFGPDGDGPFWVERILSRSLPGTRKKELGGIFRVVAREVAIGDVVIRTDPAITEITVASDDGSTIL